MRLSCSVKRVRMILNREEGCEEEWEMRRLP
jgi:hypothetical protein